MSRRRRGAPRRIDWRPRTMASSRRGDAEDVGESCAADVYSVLEPSCRRRWCPACARAAEAPTPRHQDGGKIFASERESRAVVRPRLGVADRRRRDRDCGLVRSRSVVIRRPTLVPSIGGAPDLVIEVLSPMPRVGRIEDRLKWFAQYGVRECWLVHQFEAGRRDPAMGGGPRFDRRRFGARDRLSRRCCPPSTPRSRRF